VDVTTSYFSVISFASSLLKNQTIVGIHFDSHISVKFTDGSIFNNCISFLLSSLNADNNVPSFHQISTIFKFLSEEIY
jgi:hypothetical protein